MKWHEKIGHTVDRVSDALGTVSAALILAICGLIAVSVIMRYLFNSPYRHTEEVSSYLLVAVVFFGLAYTLKERGHVRVELVMLRLRPHIRRILARTTAAVGLVWAAVLLVGVTTLWQKYLVHGSESYGLLHVPLWIPVTPLVIGAMTLLIQLVVEVFRGGQPPE